MNVLYFAKREPLIRALSAGVIPTAIAESAVQFGIDEMGGYWIQPSVALAKSIASALTKLGGEIRSRAAIKLDKSASRWAEMVPIHPVAEQPAERALLEWTRMDQIPAWTAQLRRLGGSIIAWRLEPKRAWAVVAPVPFHALAQPLPTGWSAFVEQAPGFWVEHGFQHPAPIIANNPTQVIVRHGQTWEAIPPIGAARKPARFSLPAQQEESWPSVAVAIPVAPRLVTDSRRNSPTLWVLPADGDATLREWLQHSDDRMVRQLQVGRIDTSGGSRIVLLTHADVERGPLIMLNAPGYCSYLKLNNLFVPVGRRLSPGLRRDVARRTYAPRTDHLVWLDNDGRGGLIASTMPFSGFRPLVEMVQYHVPAAKDYISAEPQPLFPVPPLVIKDRPSPKIRPKLVAPITAQSTIDVEPTPGIINSLIAWVKGAWQVTAATPPATIPPSAAAVPELPRVPPPADPPVSRWHELSDQVRTMIHQGHQPSTELLTELARTAMRERRYDEAAWCWQQILWQGNTTTEAALGWVQCENVKAGGQASSESWSAGQVAAQVVHWSLTDQPAPLPADFTLRRLTENENKLPVRAVWLAQRALSRRAGNDVLTLARVRDRLLNRLFQHGINLELDAPAFLRADDFRQNDRVAVARTWLERLPDTLSRWLGDRPTTPDQLEVFGLARERINTIEYAYVMTSWGLAVVGATSLARELANLSLERLVAHGPVHSWLADAFRHRLHTADRVGRPTGRWPEELQQRWRQLSFDHRFAVDRLQQFSRILDPLGIIGPDVVFQNGLEHPLVQLAFVSVAEFPRAVDSLLQRTRPTPAARLPVLTQALKLAPPAGDSLVRSLIDQLLLELDPFTAAPAQWRGLHAGLSAAALLQDHTSVQRLVNRWLEWLRGADQLSAGLDHMVAMAIPALRRMGMDAIINDVITETQRLLAASPREALPTLLIDNTRLAVAGGLFAMGSDDAALRILDQTRRLLFTQGEYETRDRSVLAVSYVESLRFASARVTVGRLDELVQRLPAPADCFHTNAFFALAPLQLIDAMVRTAANEDLALGSKVRRWLDADESAIRRRILTDVAELMRESMSVNHGR